MADFRKLFYALAMVALVVGLSIPASAQGTAVNCNATTTPTVARAEGYAELMGDYILTCFGGTPTTPGTAVPQVNLLVFLTGVNITSKLTSSNGVFNEALLIIDEPNSPNNRNGAAAASPIRNCGAASEDVGSQGVGVCQIIAPPAVGGLPNPAATYDGSATSGSCATYGCTRPNVFQARQGQTSNSVVFAGVPFDPPGTAINRTLRITNVRADAEFLGVGSNTLIPQPITMSVAFTNTTFITINNLSGQLLTVATVLKGLNVLTDGKGDTLSNNLGFLQCNSENSGLTRGTATTGFDVPQPAVTFVEGFQNAWKTKNVSFVTTTGAGSFLGNGNISLSAAQYVAGSINYPSDMAQNVPGNDYNTEAGFEFNSTTPQPVPNPPLGQGNQVVPPNGSVPLADPLGSGISSAGVATQGTRLALNFSNQPQGLSIWVPPVVFLFNPLAGAGVNPTGVMVLTNTAADGSGAFAPPTGISGALAAAGHPRTGAISIGGNALVQVSNGLAVWEILFSDPFSIEESTVPVVVSYVSNLSANPPIGLPVPGQVEQVAASFAPFYTTSAARFASLTLPVPRFLPGNTPLNIIEVVKCACDMLFPFVASTGGFDTGIAVANTSLDPGAAFGFGATPQQGTVTFFYFGVGNNGAAPPASQTSANVPAGQVLTYVLSSGGGSIGTSANGLDNRANGFEGYIIAQANFQYCHSYAFISPLGGGPTSSGVSEGYLGLILDPGGLVRTAQRSENLVH